MNRNTHENIPLGNPDDACKCTNCIGDNHLADKVFACLFKILLVHIQLKLIELTLCSKFNNDCIINVMLSIFKYNLKYQHENQ